MKYYNLIILLSFVTIIFFSCKKDNSTGSYSCKCSGGFSGQGQTMPIIAATNTEAETKCNAYNQPNTNDGYYGCHLE